MSLDLSGGAYTRSERCSFTLMGVRDMWAGVYSDLRIDLIISRWRFLTCAAIDCFFFQAEDGIRDLIVTGVQTCALPICERTKRKHGKKTSRKQRKANAVYSKWAFAELHSMIAYKVLFHGSMAIKVDAHYTSKACPMCGHTSDANRPKKGLLFVCQNCHYTLHADLVGARNIALRTLLVRQDWTSTGSLSVSLDGSDAETKAAQRQRYAELRWSPGPSLLSSDMG